MGVIFWIVWGGIVGSVARLVMNGPRAGGMPMGIMIGIGAAMIGGLIGTVMAGELTFAVDPRSALLACSVSLLVLLCYRSFALRFEEQPWRL
jgi:uncharacterized membrane protein YeaQ/YmgE (transglycosylase-associated protein family)